MMKSGSSLAKLDASRLKALETSLTAEMTRRTRTNRLNTLYPNEGPLSRAHYPKHLAFFEAGSRYSERAAIAANRVGKTWGIGGYETALHLTGLYPVWWNGRRFLEPIEAWACGDTTQTTRDIVQSALLGPMGSLGEGLIPQACIEGQPLGKQGVTGSVDMAYVKHSSGGISMLGFKSYDQRRQSFQGTAKHLIWLDEEPPLDVYSECLLRLMTTQGMMLCTFTPLMGLSDVALMFMPELTEAA